jgi:pimeloyl-ACP methyl ester carboxylesterase
MEIKSVITGKGRVEYSVTGEGKPVLFLHGGHSNCRETLFHKGFDIRRHQLVTPSRPGYGNTPLNGNCTPRKTADLIISLMDYLHIEKTVIYGISAGGLTSLELAGNYPERVEKLVLASAVTQKWLRPTDNVYKAARGLFNPACEKFVWGGVRAISALSPALIARSFHSQFSKAARHGWAQDEIAELTALFAHFSSQKGFLCDIDHDIDDNLLAAISCPTLIVHSRNDNSVPFEHARHANEQIRNSTLCELNNKWGHLFWIGRDSQEAIRHIMEFIDS